MVICNPFEQRFMAVSFCHNIRLRFLASLKSVEILQVTLERRGEEQYQYYSSSTRQLCKPSPKGTERISPVGKKWRTGTWNLSSHSRLSNRAIREHSTVSNTGTPRKSRHTRKSLSHFMVNECHLLHGTREAKTEARNQILKEPSDHLFSHVPSCTSLYLGLLRSFLNVSNTAVQCKTEPLMVTRCRAEDSCWQFQVMGEREKQTSGACMQVMAAWKESWSQWYVGEIPDLTVTH